ncbi:MAG: sugar transferase [Bacillota bacterium]
MSKKSLRRLPAWLLATGDMVVLNLALIMAFYLRFAGSQPSSNYEALVSTLPWVSLTALMLFAGLGLYEQQLGGLVPVMRALLPAVLITGLATAAIAFWIRGFAFPRSVLLFGVLGQFCGLLVWRGICWHAARVIHGQRQLLVIGSEETACPFLEKLLDLPRGLFRIQGVVAPWDMATLKEQLPEVDGVIVSPGATPENKATVVALCLEAGREVYLVPELYEVMLTGARVEQLDDLPVLQVEDISLSYVQAAVKRALDVIVTFMILVVTLPIVIIAALSVRLSSPGPVFYVQERVGYRGRVFNLPKLRTMVDNAEKDTGPVLAKADDGRVTWAGKFLRSTRIDELPQLFSVLKGDMSLVGPRPERPVFVDEFQRAHPAYRYRHVVKPGLTGVAQVYGRYTTSWEDKLRYDLYYIRNYSLILDLRVLLRTVPVALSPSAARGRTKGQDKTEAVHALFNTMRQETTAGNKGKVVEGSIR